MEMSSSLVAPNISPRCIYITFAPVQFKCNHITTILLGVKFRPNIVCKTSAKPLTLCMYGAEPTVCVGNNISMHAQFRLPCTSGFIDSSVVVLSDMFTKEILSVILLTYNDRGGILG